MIPPIFSLCAADAAVTALLGSAPVRLYPFGLAPQGVARPYAMWQGTAAPENYIAGRADADAWSIQVDIYAGTDQLARDTAAAVRHAVELSAYVTALRIMPRDPETMDYRYTMQIDFIVSR